MTKFRTPAKTRHLMITSGISLSLLAGCANTPPLNPFQWLQSNPTQTHAQSATTPQVPYTGEVELSIDPSLMGQQYQHHRKLKIQSDGSFQTQAAFKFAKPLTPKVLCVEDQGNGTYTAHFGYHNENDQSVSVPLGPHNKVLGGHVNPGDNSKDKNLGQPSQFESGEHGTFPQSVFSVDFSHGNVNWVLNGKTATAKANSTACGPQPSPDPSSSPSPDPSPSPTASPDPTPTPTATPVDVVFDPADPSSLGDLYPDVPGNANEEIPQTGEMVLTINQQALPSAAIGETLIHVAEPVQENLARIQEKYVGAVLPIDEADGIYLLKINMKAVDLSQLENNLRLLNEELIGMGSEQFQSIAFGNLESARTFALIADLLASQWVKGADFNTIINTDSVYTSNEDPGGLNLNLVPNPSPLRPLDNDVNNYWWLNEHSTNVLGAWTYNMGYNRVKNKPVQIAVIDAGFAGMDQLMSNRQDFAGKILSHLAFQDRQTYGYETIPIAPGGCLFCTTVPEINTPSKPLILADENKLTCNDEIRYIKDNPGVCALSGTDAYRNYLFLRGNSIDNYINYPEAHGTKATSTIISALSNNSGIAGVAPQAQVIPIKVGNGAEGSMRMTEIIHALKIILEDSRYNEVDVISMSIGGNITDNTLINRIISGRFGDGTQQRLTKVIQDLSYKGVISVFSAANNGINAKYNQYILKTSAIAVGAVQIPPVSLSPILPPSLPALPNPSGLQRSVWSTSEGSNWSPAAANNSNSTDPENLVNVYAPGSDMIAMSIPLTRLAGSPTGSNIFVPRLNSSNQVTTVDTYSWSGTSAAAPVIAGIVALMKGIKEDIYTTEVRNAFYTTSSVSRYADNFLRKPDGTFESKNLELRIVNAQAALRKIYEDNNIGAGTGEATTYFGTLKQNGDAYQLQTSTGIYTLQWGDTQSVNLLNTRDGLQVIDRSSSTRQFTGVLNAVNQGVKVIGHLQGSRLFVNQLELIRVPLAPTSLFASSIQSNSFKISWDTVPFATSYDVRINNAFYQNVTSPELLIQYYPTAPTPLTPGTNYTVDVRAKNAVGTSALSQEINVMTLNPTPTPSPTCTKKITDIIVTDASWLWSGGNVSIVNNPYFTPRIADGALPIWVSTGACTQCSYVMYKNYSLPLGSYVNKAHVEVQASEYADVSVRGRGVGQASYQNSVNPKRFDIDPSFFGTGGNNLSLSFLAQNFNLPRPAVLAKFSIERCE